MKNYVYVFKKRAPIADTISGNGYYTNSEGRYGYDRPCLCLHFKRDHPIDGLATVSLSPMLAADDASRPAPPATPEHDVVENYHGRQVHDPYRWLEKAGAPAVEQWIDSQNAYTDAVMSGFRDHGAIIKRVGQLALTSTQRSNPQIVANVLFYIRQTPPQPQPVLVAEAWPNGEPKVFVDTGGRCGCDGRPVDIFCAVGSRTEYASAPTNAVGPCPKTCSEKLECGSGLVCQKGFCVKP